MGGAGDGQKEMIFGARFTLATTAADHLASAQKRIRSVRKRIIVDPSHIMLKIDFWKL